MASFPGRQRPTLNFRPFTLTSRYRTNSSRHCQGAGELPGNCNSRRQGQLSSLPIGGQGVAAVRSQGLVPGGRQDAACNLPDASLAQGHMNESKVPTRRERHVAAVQRIGLLKHARGRVVQIGTTPIGGAHGEDRRIDVGGVVVVRPQWPWNSRWRTNDLFRQHNRVRGAVGEGFRQGRVTFEPVTDGRSRIVSKHLVVASVGNTPHPG
jgi:hypothetical protein